MGEKNQVVRKGVSWRFWDMGYVVAVPHHDRGGRSRAGTCIVEATGVPILSWRFFLGGVGFVVTASTAQPWISRSIVRFPVLCAIFVYVLYFRRLLKCRCFLFRFCRRPQPGRGGRKYCGWTGFLP